MKVSWVFEDDTSKPRVKPRDIAYRIIKFEHLVRLFRNRKYVLTKPFAWEDPFESLWSQLVFRSKAAHERLTRRVFASCLTFEARSDAMWSIYSRNWLGVRITIELEELQRQMEEAPSLALGRIWFGEMNYLDDRQLERKAANLMRVIGRESVDSSAAIARAWLNKRIAYRHESEMRVLFVLPNDKAVRVDQPTFEFDIDPHRLIKAIHIDPRAPKEVFETLYREIRNELGFARSIRHSSLLRLPPKLQAMLPS